MDEGTWTFEGKRYQKGEPIPEGLHGGSQRVYFCPDFIMRDTSPTPFLANSCWAVEVPVELSSGLVLEVGKAFRTRGGWKAEIINRMKSDNGGYPWVGKFRTGRDLWPKCAYGRTLCCAYNEAGVCAGDDHVCDLVAPWPDAPEGYEDTGEFREPRYGEPYVMPSGVYPHVPMFSQGIEVDHEDKFSSGKKRHILKKIEAGAGGADTPTGVNRKVSEPAAVQPPGQPGGSLLAPASPDPVTSEDAKGMCKGPDELFYHMEEARLELLSAEIVRTDRAIAKRLARMKMIDNLDADSRPKAKVKK